MFDMDDDGAASYGPDGSWTWNGKAVLRLTHSSGFQFFQDNEGLSNHAREFAVASPTRHLMIAQASLAYLLHLDSVDINSASVQAAVHYPLVDYTVKHWYSHTQGAGVTARPTLASLIRSTPTTRPEIYQLVTYTNISTRSNP